MKLQRKNIYETKTEKIRYEVNAQRFNGQKDGDDFLGDWETIREFKNLQKARNFARAKSNTIKEETEIRQGDICEIDIQGFDESGEIIFHEFWLYGKSNNMNC